MAPRGCGPAVRADRSGTALTAAAAAASIGAGGSRGVEPLGGIALTGCRVAASLHVELGAFRVEHGDVVLAVPRLRPGKGRARRRQPVGFAADVRARLDERDAGAPTHVQ